MLIETGTFAGLKDKKSVFAAEETASRRNCKLQGVQARMTRSSARVSTEKDIP